MALQNGESLERRHGSVRLPNFDLNDRFHLKVVDGNGTSNSPKYCYFIREFIPYGIALFKDAWIVEQVGATPHTAEVTQHFH